MAKRLPISMVIGLLLPWRVMAFDPVPPSFPLQEGWLGGDCAYSIPLGAGNRAVWLFGDTYIRNDEVLSRAGAAMVANTIAIRTSDGTNQTIHYYWQHQTQAAPDAFFSSGTDAWKYWPEDGFVANGKLYVCLIRIQTTGPGAFGFQGTGVDLAVIDNPQDPPPAWQITCTQLSSSPKIFPGIAAAVEGDYAYLFADEDDAAHRGNRPILLARIALKALDSTPAANLEYLAAGNIWKAGPIGRDAKRVMDKGVTEMTVKWHPDRGRWVAVQISNEFPAHHLWRRQAPSVTGPWSAPVSIYSIPEYSRSNAGYGRDRFFYAGKEHIESLNPTNGNVIVTYVGNSLSEADVQNDLALYVPEAVRLEVDPISGGASHGSH